MDARECPRGSLGHSREKTKKTTLFGDIKIILNHPQFKPLRKIFAIWVVATLVLGGYWAYTLISAQGASAATNVDDTQVEFNTGTYAHTQYDSGNSWVESITTAVRSCMDSCSNSRPCATSIAHTNNSYKWIY